MEKVLSGQKWETTFITKDKVADVYNAKNLLDEISKATHLCGDPGLQYKDTINKWHTCKNSGVIFASNPCSEYVFLDDTACNLASINLMKYRKDDTSFDLESYLHTIDLLITAQEITVSNSGYPNKKIEQNSHLYRTLGLGYTNLGALLMSLGLPYNSNSGRNYAASLTSILTGRAYLQSSKIAAMLGPFTQYENNKQPMLEVMDLHLHHALKLEEKGVDPSIYQYSKEVWKKVKTEGKNNGFRNAQVTVLAPTGTISFMMDADTTGIEPEIATVKYKKLVGGGYMTIINQTIPLALKKLGYSTDEIEEINNHILERGNPEDAPYLSKEHLAVFDTSLKPDNGKRFIHHLGHIKMMAATQPFLSGAISKTVNMPKDATIEDINKVYTKAWKLGLKAIAIYRDKSKRLQPLNTSKETTTAITAEISSKPLRKRLPDTRKSVTHKFEIGEQEGYITVGLYEDGKPGEVFIQIAKQGSTLDGLMDALGILVSMTLQYGVPLSALVNKFIHTKFEPSGFTSNNNITHASSIIDYIFTWLAMEFLSEEEFPISLEHLKKNKKNQMEVQRSRTPVNEIKVLTAMFVLIVEGLL